MASKRSIDVLSWIAAHPVVDDVDAASEMALSAIERMPPGEMAAVHEIADLLNQLIDTIGNCKTEEINLKMLLWSDIVTRAVEVRDSIEPGQ